MAALGNTMEVEEDAAGDESDVSIEGMDLEEGDAGGDDEGDDDIVPSGACMV